MTTPPSTPGRVVSITPLPKIEATEVELSNGIVIAFQRSTRRKEHIAFQGFALGGSSELSEYEETAFCMIDEVAGLSGLGELNGDALANLTSTWQTRVNTQRHTYHRGIGGSCPAARFELVLQLLHQKFTPGAQRFKAGSLAKVVAVQLEGIKHREKTPEVRAGVLRVFWGPLAISARSLPDPHNPSHAHSCPHRILAVHTILLQFHFGERARLAAYGDVSIMRPISAEVLEKVSVDDLSRLYEAAFTADPSAFTFSFVGELPEDEVLLPLFETYLGSLGGTAPIADGHEATKGISTKPTTAVAPAMNALPFCGVCSVADLGSCGCCAEPTDGATGGATDAHTSDPSSSMANSGPTIGSSVADGGAADATVAGTTAVNSATSTSAASVASTPSPWALSPGQTTFAPTTLTAVFNPGKDIVRAGRHTPDVKASCLLAWRTNMPSPGDPDADTALEMRIKVNGVQPTTRA
mmetsp:Transcript_104115/g.299901  ORF Transcript_104115/g.299901 Transcript_104115/m.299901 type:complete len:468 (-) Transcript_104115:1056-2459(-)